MIRKFSVENYRSIKNKQTISFIPNSKMNYGIENYVLLNATKKVKLLKFAVLYGYNASGKSTILEAFDYLRTIQLNAHFSKNESTGFEPFAFDESTALKGTFKLSFYLDEVLYDYSITLDKKRIYDEELKYTPQKRAAMLYHRVWNNEKGVSEILFSPKLNFPNKSKTILIGNCIENNTVLASYSRSNIYLKELSKLFDYFNNYVAEVVKPKNSLTKLSENRVMNDLDCRNLYSILIKKAELQISDIKVIDKKFNDAKGILDTFKDLQNNEESVASIENETKSDKTLVFEHTNNNGSFYFSKALESRGTIRYFGLETIMQRLLSSNKFVAIDEFDTSLHPELVSRYIEIFLVNSLTSQLMITINNLYIMDQDYMRPDMIWFCEKKEDGSSTYYSAQDFKYHKRISTYKHYRDGKFGTLPHYGSSMIEDLNTADRIN